mmetsp:Transcript_1736/g.6106  ORF Transcript_1736/g.6106 Transcript_1736/m.6106 type:complete len:343 (-) Transcript_1736:149-1177(-)
MASSKEYVLVTGGAGYIGSHTVCQLLEKGHNVLIVDNLDNSSLVAVERVREIAKLRLESGDVELIMKVTDLLDKSSLEAIFQQYAFTSCIHFAGLKAVGESVRLPMQYYHNNLTGTLHLVELLSKYGCKTIVFSSSATVYGQPEKVPATEDLSLGATNPYGRTKLYIEQILRDVYASDSSWSIALLRYFNPVGAHPSGLIGEDPKGIPNNLMPFVQQVWYRWLIPLHRRGHTVTTHFCVGCCWAAGMLERFWRRLPNKGWYRCSRLHSCHGFSRRAYSCARHYVKVEDGLWVPGNKPRDRQGDFRARDSRSFPGSQRTGHPHKDSEQTSGRCCGGVWCNRQG